jgi:Predicted membrane protein
VEENIKKLIVLIIDIDDDIGSVTGKSLIFGRDEVMKAAIDFAEKRPEDADTNAIFAGLNLYENLRTSNNDTEIAIVGGHPTNNMLAQILIKDRVKQLLEKIGNKNVEFYLVSDGTDELLVAEVLRDLAPIAGLRRVIVEQHLGVEGSYFLLARYIRKAIEDPKYSKYFLGIPGILVALFGILSVFGYIFLALKIMLAIIGIFLIVKGFNIEDRTYNILKGFTNYLRETSHFQIAGIGILGVTILASVLAGYYSALSKENLITFSGSIIANSIPILLTGFTLYIVVSRVFYKVTKSNLNILKETASIAIIISLALAFYQLGITLENYGLKVGIITGSVVINLFIGSGFLLYSVAGAGIAALIELADYLYFRRSKR